MSAVILKIDFRNKNYDNKKSADSKYLDYIATREGVALNNLTIPSITTENEIYVKYIDERPNSHGLFDKNGNADLEKYKNEIASTNATVYRAIISLKRETADEIGLKNRDGFYNAFKDASSDYFKALGLNPYTVSWCGAFHDEGHHPHMHIMFYQEGSTINLLPVLEKERIIEARESLTKNFMRDKYLRLINDKNTIKEKILDTSKILMYNKKTARLFEELVADLKADKKGGRTAYKFLDIDKKAKVDKIYQKIISDPFFLDANKDFQNTLRELNLMFEKEKDTESEQALSLQIKNLILTVAKNKAKENLFAWDTEEINNILKHINPQKLLSKEVTQKLAKQVSEDMYKDLGMLGSAELFDKICDYNRSFFKTDFVKTIPPLSTETNDKKAISTLLSLGLRESEVLERFEKLEKTNSISFNDIEDYLSLKQLSKTDEVLFSLLKEGNTDLIKAFKTTERSLTGFYSPYNLESYNRVLKDLSNDKAIKDSPKNFEILENLTEKGLVKSNSFTEVGWKLFDDFERNNLLLTPEEKRLLYLEDLSREKLKELAEGDIVAVRTLLTKVDRLIDQKFLMESEGLLKPTPEAKLFLFANADSNVKTFLDRIDYLEKLGLVKTEDGNISLGDNFEKYIANKVSNPDRSDLVDKLDKNNGLIDKDKEEYFRRDLINKYIKESKEINPTDYIQNTEFGLAVSGITKLCEINGVDSKLFLKDISFSVEPKSSVITKTEITAINSIFGMDIEYRDLILSQNHFNSLAHMIKREIEKDKIKNKNQDLEFLPRRKKNKTAFGVEIYTTEDFIRFSQ